MLSGHSQILTVIRTLSYSSQKIAKLLNIVSIDTSNYDAITAEICQLLFLKNKTWWWREMHDDFCVLYSTQS